MMTMMMRTVLEIWQRGWCYGDSGLAMSEVMMAWCCYDDDDDELIMMMVITAETAGGGGGKEHGGEWGSGLGR
ncbi:hypothetical protein Tco_1397435 [Tanacetum coccineum]